MRGARVAIALALAVGLNPRVALADVEEAVGVGVEAMSLAGAVGAVGGHPSATVYNPAGLSELGDEGPVAQLGLSFFLAVPDLWVRTLDDGASLPDVTPAPGNYGVIIGARFDVGRGLGIEGLHLGVTIYSPVQGLVLSTIVPDDRVQWMMWTDRLTHIGVFAGLSMRLARWLSVGAGVRVTFDTETFISGATTSVADIDGDVVVSARLGVQAAIFFRAAPVLGLRIAPIEALRLAFSWRGAIAGEDWGWARLQFIPGLPDLGFLHRFAHVVRPHALRWAAAYRVIDELEVSADLEWQLWSETVSGNNAPLEGRFGDTLVPALGVRVTPVAGIDVMAGYRYEPSPFQNFGGPTNLLAANRHLASLGLRVDLEPLIEGETVPLSIGIAGRLAFLETGTEEKNGRRFLTDDLFDANPGTPGYRYGGVVPSAQLELETRW